MRERERQRLQTQALARTRARRGTPKSRLLARTRFASLFAVSLAAGLLLATPLQERLGQWASGELGQLESIAVQGNRHLSAEEIARATGAEPGSRLAAVETHDVERRLRSQPWIRDARVLRLPPGRLLVRVEERHAEAVLADRASDGGEPQSWRLVDATGTPFARAEEADIAALPHLLGDDGLKSDESHVSLVTALELSSRLRSAVQSGPPGLADAMELHLPQVGSPEGWVLRSRERSVEVLLGRVQLFDRLDRLEQILAARLSETREAVRIDLRFADQAVLRRVSASG